MNVEKAKDVISEFIEIFKTLRAINLSGYGESFLYPNLLEIIDYIKSKDDSTLIHIATNANLPNAPEIVDAIADKVSALLISLDGLNEEYEVFRKGSNYKLFTDNLDEISRIVKGRKIGVYFNSVITMNNYQQMPDMVKLTKKLGFTAIHFNPINLIFNDWDVSYYNFYLSNDFKEKLEEAVALAKQEGVLAAHSIMPDMHNPLGFGDCHYYRDELFVTWDGFLTLCCIKPFPKELNFGNVFETGLKKCVGSEEFLRYRKMHEAKITPQICKRCYLLSEDIIKNHPLSIKKLSQFEEKIFNEGERMIPGVTHDIDELVRHRSSYLFFKKVIESDMECGLVSKPVRIVDLGCGVGHGCHTLSEIPGVQVVGVDNSSEAIEYAQTHYSRPNISYQLVNLLQYISVIPEFDYVVSRHVFEHISSGLELALSTKCRNRVIFEVPYDEAEGNPYHVLLGIREEDFSKFPEAELFFQDLDGIIYDLRNKPAKPNGIICVYGRSDFPKVGSSNISFPLPAWVPEEKEYRQLFRQYFKLRVEHKILQQEHQTLVQEHQVLQNEHQVLQNEHQALVQSRAVQFAREMGRHPLLLKAGKFTYGVLAGIFKFFKG